MQLLLSRLFHQHICGKSPVALAPPHSWEADASSHPLPHVRPRDRHRRTTGDLFAELPEGRHSQVSQGHETEPREAGTPSLDACVAPPLT